MKKVKILLGDKLVVVSEETANLYLAAEASLIVAKGVYAQAVKDLVDEDYKMKVQARMLIY